MNVKKLKEILSEYNDDMEVLVYDDDDAYDIIATELRHNPYGKGFVMLCVDYEWQVKIGDLV